MSRGIQAFGQNSLVVLAALLVLLCGVGLFTGRVENIPSYLCVAMLCAVMAQNLGLRQQIDALNAKVSAISEK